MGLVPWPVLIKAVNLLALRTEVSAHGFDPVQFGSSRIVQFLNDAQSLACSRVDYYVDEATQDFSTVSGTATYPQPANLGTDRSLRDTGRNVELLSVGLRTIDRSAAVSGAPNYYALDGNNLHLYPTPDGVYPLELRYWLLPPDLVNDTDTPTIPVRHHPMLIEYAVGQCFWSEDDEQRGQAWDAKFEKSLAIFAGDVKFPNDDAPTQVADMWRGPPVLGSRGWRF